LQGPKQNTLHNISRFYDLRCAKPDAIERTAAHGHLRSVYDRDGLKVIVVPRDEIEALRSTDDLGNVCGRNMEIA
jgi:hypothetical protein